MVETYNPVHRPLGDWLLSHAGSQVLILEGARAVGKTTLVKQQLARTHGFHYVTLADQPTRALATADLRGWLRRLPLPLIIDEAQMIAELPLEVKEYTDEHGVSGNIVLTGSASIGRTGLGGADPLARRAVRRTLHPLTLWERREQPGSLVDSLFDGTPQLRRQGELQDEELLTLLRRGGFPKYVVADHANTIDALRVQIASDIAAVLSDTVLPEYDLNPSKARATLNRLLRGPGGILNAAGIGREIEIDKRTIERHLHTFGRLFLLQWLPNLALPPQKQSFARAKIHPVDTSFAVDALERAGVHILTQREYFGQLLESHVVCEVLANAQWANRQIEAYYWRQASSSNPEVDLVIIDERDREIAIEVKAATQIYPADLKGIRAYAKQRKMHRGFVFYRGEEVVRLDDNIWALPYSALGNVAFFTEAPQPDPPSSVMSGLIWDELTDTEAVLMPAFLPEDNTALHGKIEAFVQDVAASYGLLFGGKVHVSSTRSEGRAVGHGIQTVPTVFMPAITPASSRVSLTSKICSVFRKERPASPNDMSCRWSGLIRRRCEARR
ncbi:ATP-binding protein [Leucobacter insecticola]|uniref:ATP-binding protein n=1 Tax=Leucobacter insecticola TaxID=2714934 RepID=A0A6G8FGB0_9MICO|nr:AAA family ATPase [Leucobacter insecticola]QIM15377.1 ATP-binding protein [Leucobacter insecticola]